MIASVHIADVGPRRALALQRSTPSPASTPGLRTAHLAFGAPLSARALPTPQPGRLALVAMWDDDDAVSRFLADSPLAAALADGWRVRLEPLRAHGTWPGLPADVPLARNVAHEGPVAVLTLGRLRFSQTVRFFRASSKAAGAASEATGLRWGTAMARPPFVATCSLWESSQAAATYAYGEVQREHPDAIAAGRAKPFHHREAFIRFRPYDEHGRLDGKNPMT